MAGPKDNHSIAIGHIDTEMLIKSGYLTFFGAEITTVPKELLRCTHIHTLNLNDSPISRLGFAARLNNIRRLRISFTNIKTLKEIVGLTELEELECTGTTIDDSYKIIFDLPKLTTLIMNPLKSGRFGSVPREILSAGSENCLDRLKDYIKSIESGASRASNIKLFLYGNGEVGKTQLLRRLSPPDHGPIYDVRIPTTHGVNIKTFTLEEHPHGTRASTLEAPSRHTKVRLLDSANAVKIRAWDFGGQDLYHGVHALFFRDHAIHLIAWTSDREQGFSQDSLGYPTANHPVQYWLSFARHRWNDSSAVLLIQTQADTEEKEHRWTHDQTDSLKGDFSGYFVALSTSSKQNRGFDELRYHLNNAAKAILRSSNWHLVADSWIRIEQKIEDIQSRNEQMSPGYRATRVLSYSDFKRLAVDSGADGGVDTILHYLSAIGVLIWDKILFPDRVIIDQQWALDAIYSVFDRTNSVVNLRRSMGRFTSDDIAQWIWDEQAYSRDEQALFIKFMLACRVCFPYEYSQGRQTYIAPNALPTFESVAEAIALGWDDSWPTKQVTLKYDLLHDGLLRGVMCDVGVRGGHNVTYWKDGFQFYDSTTQSRLRLQMRRGVGWSGIIEIFVQSNPESNINPISDVSRSESDDNIEPSDLLGSMILGLINKQQVYFDIYPKEGDRGFVPVKGAKVYRASAVDPEPTRDPDASKGLFVSYAWGDETSEGIARAKVIEQFCEEANRRGIKVSIDKSELRIGDSITSYMDKLSQGSRVYVFISKKYLMSRNCMQELTLAWIYSRNNWENFSNRVKIYILPCANMFSLEKRTEMKLYWSSIWREIKESHEKIDPMIMTRIGSSEKMEIDKVGAIAANVFDLLTIIVDHIVNSNFNDFCDAWLRDVGEM